MSDYLPSGYFPVQYWPVQYWPVYGSTALLDPNDYAPMGYYRPLGSDRYLGRGPSRQKLLYQIIIDWDMDGDIDGWNEFLWLIPATLEINRGRENFVKPNGDGFERIEVGNASFELDNYSGRYDPRNTDSPLYPHLLTTKERNAKILVKNTDDGELKALITGRMVDFQPSSDGRGRKRMRVRLADATIQLQGVQTNIDIQTEIKTNEAIAAILDDIGWPWGSNLENAVETIPYWWVFGRSPFLEIHELTESELGQFFVAANGDATFQSRYHIDYAPLALNGGEIGPEIIERQPAETLRDKVVVKIHPRVVRATGTIWTLQDAPGSLAAGESVELWPEYSYDGQPAPAVNVLTPVASVDYDANENALGSGADLTANLSVSLTNFGAGGKLVVSNTGATGLYYWLQVRGDALDAPDTVSKKAGSGDRVFVLDLPWQQKVASGKDAADYLHEALSDPAKYYLTISVTGLPDKQFEKDLMDWIDLTIANRKISALFRISKIRHRAVARSLVQTTFWIEPLVGVSTDDANSTQLPFLIPAQL